MQTFFFFLKPFFKATSRYNNNKKSTKAFGQHLEQRFSLPVDWRRCQMILFISQGRARLGSLPLHWKMHFSEVKVSSPLWCLQGVLGFNCASAQANVLLWTGLDTGVTGVCVCVWVSGWMSVCVWFFTWERVWAGEQERPGREVRTSQPLNTIK